MGNVLIAFLGICISCAAVIAGARVLYRLLAARPAPRHAALPERAAAAATRAQPRDRASEPHIWVPAARIAHRGKTRPVTVASPRAAEHHANRVAHP
jgi:H+/gluconate symporter-like permease